MTRTPTSSSTAALEELFEIPSISTHGNVLFLAVLEGVNIFDNVQVIKEAHNSHFFRKS